MTPKEASKMKIPSFPHDHELVNEIRTCLSGDERFIYKGQTFRNSAFFITKDYVDLTAPCSGSNLDCAQYQIALLGMNPNGVEIHIEMNAVGINEWETVFWGTCDSLSFFQTLIHKALGIPDYKKSNKE